MSDDDHLHDDKACNHEDPPDTRCVWCHGKGYNKRDGQRWACSDCNGSGYAPDKPAAEDDE